MIEYSIVYDGMVLYGIALYRMLWSGLVWYSIVYRMELDRIDSRSTLQGFYKWEW